MVSAVGGDTSQLFTSLVATGSIADLSQSFTTVVLNFPAQSAESSQMFVTIPTVSDLPAEVSQLFVNAVVRGRIAQPKVRAWTFTLDGHDFYVLRLGDSQTFIYDVYSKQWARWYTADLARWRFLMGQNWLGSDTFAAGFGSNVVCGDDTFGVLWMLDPLQPWDEDPILGAEAAHPFIRKATAQITSRQRIPVPCYEVYLTGDSGYTIGTSTDVTLSTSDDNGNTFVSHGAVTSTPGDYNQEFAWRSLGQIRYPGRLFVIEDSGALQRINGLDVNIGPEE